MSRVGQGVAIDGPFDKKHWTPARELVQNHYHFLLGQQGLGSWAGRSREMPHVFGEGIDANSCLGDTRKANYGAVAHMLERGEEPPLWEKRT